MKNKKADKKINSANFELWPEKQSVTQSRGLLKRSALIFSL